VSGAAFWIWRLIGIALCLLATATPVQAHEMTIAEMTVREADAGLFVWSWGVPGRNKPLSEDLTPRWPDGCRGDERAVRCGAQGMVGTLAIDGVGKNYSAVIVSINWRGGERSVYTLTDGQPQVQLFGSAHDGRGTFEVMRTYALLGVEHILSGFDHLLFVLSLLMLVGFRRQLLTTVTSFTVAHSVTLAASALGALTLRPAPVEAVIALSIVLVSAEALHDRQTLTRRFPAIVAFVFGLVHGLGFAGALKNIGLPEQHVNAALLAFNVGVEAGQLLVIGLAFGVALAWRRWALPLAARRVALYGIGTLAVYWTLGRLVTLVS